MVSPAHHASTRPHARTPRFRGATRRALLVLAAIAVLGGCSGVAPDDSTPTIDADDADDAQPTPTDSTTVDEGSEIGGDVAPAVDSSAVDVEAIDTRPVEASVDAVTPPAGWTLTWSDEFDAPTGSAADASKWKNEVGGGGFGNAEHEYYTDGTANAVQADGSLVITAKKESGSKLTCWYGACGFTSARLVTKGKFAQKYGRFEARIKLPYGQGLWPAFWLLGDDIDAAHWPTCGEVDIMENIGREPSTNHGSAHGPGYSGGASLTGKYALAAGKRLADDFHVFSLEWEPNVLRYYVDGALYETRTPKDLPGGARWVFDHPFFILLNVAVGGVWPGEPDGSTVFPQTMQVDYVRVYQKT